MAIIDLRVEYDITTVSAIELLDVLENTPGVLQAAEIVSRRADPADVEFPSWGEFQQAQRPAELAAAFATWAGDDPRRLYGAWLNGNGITKRAFLRRLLPEQLRALIQHARQYAPPPGGGIGVNSAIRYGNKELRRRGLAEV